MFVNLISVINLKVYAGVKVGSIKSSCITYPTTLLYSAIVPTGFPFTLSCPLNVKFYERSLPDRRFSIVVFPEPEGPNIAVTVLGENFPEHYFKIVLSAF